MSTDEFEIETLTVGEAGPEVGSEPAEAPEPAPEGRAPWLRRGVWVGLGVLGAAAVFVAGFLVGNAGDDGSEATSSAPQIGLSAQSLGGGDAAVTLTASLAGLSGDQEVHVVLRGIPSPRYDFDEDEEFTEEEDVPFSHDVNVSTCDTLTSDGDGHLLGEALGTAAAGGGALVQSGAHVQTDSVQAVCAYITVPGEKKPRTITKFIGIPGATVFSGPAELPG